MLALHERPVFRGRLHQAGFFASIPAGIVLVALATGTGARVTGAIFAASLTGLMTSSSLYHRWSGGTKGAVVLRKLDHVMIFLLIAGTYTPIAWLSLPHSWSIPILAVVWTAALGGALFKVLVLNDGNSRGTWIYLVIAIGSFAAAPKMLAVLGGWRSTLLIVGGLIYLIGAAILLLRRPDPLPNTFGYHEIWHGCTLVGAGCHFAVIASLTAA